MKRLIALALLAGAMLAHAEQASPAKKELVQKLIRLQQAGIEQVARGLVERPAAQMEQQALQVLAAQVPAEKREAVRKAIEADLKKYVEESVPLVRERAMKLAPSTIGSVLEEKFSEAELKQVIAWFESPVNKKYQQYATEMQNSMVQKLVADARPEIEPKLKALEQKVRASLEAGASAAAAPASAASAAPAANGTKPAASAASGSAK